MPVDPIRILLETAGDENARRLKGALDQLEQQLLADVQAFGRFDEASLKANAALNAQAQQVAQARENLEKWLTSYNKVGSASKGVNESLINSSRVFQDFFGAGGLQRPADGLRAISNNMEQLIQSFSKLSGQGLGALLGSLWGPAGLIAAITVLTALPWGAIYDKLKGLFKIEDADRFNSRLDELQHRLKEIGDKKTVVKFEGEKEQLEETIARIKQMRDELAKAFGKQTEAEQAVGKAAQQAAFGTPERREATTAAMAESIERRVAQTGIARLMAPLEQVIVQGEKRIEEVRRTGRAEMRGGRIIEPEQIIGEETAAMEKARAELERLRRRMAREADEARREFEGLQHEMTMGVGPSQEQARRRFAEILGRSAQAEARKAGAEIGAPEFAIQAALGPEGEKAADKVAEKMEEYAEAFDKASKAIQQQADKQEDEDAKAVERVRAAMDRREEAFEDEAKASRDRAAKATLERHPEIGVIAEQALTGLAGTRAPTERDISTVVTQAQRYLEARGEKGAGTAAAEVVAKAVEARAARISGMVDVPVQDRELRLRQQLADERAKFSAPTKEQVESGRDRLRAIEKQYGAYAPEIEAGALRGFAPQIMAAQLAGQIRAETGVPVAEAQKAASEIVKDATTKAGEAVNRFRDKGDDVFAAVGHAMEELFMQNQQSAARFAQWESKFNMFAAGVKQTRGQTPFNRTFGNR